MIQWILAERMKGMYTHEENRLGSSELYVGEIGLGCMSLGTEVEPAINLIHEALDRGVNLLDTADLYDAGRNEEIVGKAIQGRRDQVILATKVGNRRLPGKRAGHGIRPKRISSKLSMTASDDSNGLYRPVSAAWRYIG